MIMHTASSMKQTPAFSKVAAHYTDTVLARADITPGSRIVYRSCLNVLQRHWPGLADTPVGTITAADCERWFNRRRRMVGVSRLKMELATLKAAFDHAINKKVLRENPAASLFTDGVEHRRLEIPTRVEFTKLVHRLTFFRQHDALDMVELLACSGMTRAEAAGLIWADIDFDKETFRVRDARGVCRTVPLFPNMRRLLLKIIRRRYPAGPGRPVLRRRDCDHTLRNACKQAGLPRFHYRGLRHFFALEAVKQGINYPLIAAWLGQKDGGVQVARLNDEMWEQQNEQKMAKLMTYKAGDEMWPE